jgi:adhesin transport system outer membrane protein
MIKPLYPLISMIAVSLAFSHVSHADTIEEVVAKTVQSHPEVLADINSRLAANAVIDQAAAGYKPTLDVELGIGREWSRNSSTQFENVNLKRGEASFIATQKLYDGFETKHQVARAQAISNAAAHQIVDTSQRIAFEATQAYLNVLRSGELIVIAESNLTSHQRVNEQIELRVNSGVARASDIDQVTARVSLSQSNLFEAQGQEIDAQTNYQRVVGEMPTDDLALTKDCCTDMPTSLETALQTAMQKHPALDRYVALHEAALAETGVAKSAFQPKVNFEIEGSADNNLDGTEGHDKDLLAMIRLRQNLLNGGADSARVSETVYLSEQQKQLALIQQREIEHDVRLSWSLLQRAASLLPFLKQHAESTAKSYEAYQQQFKLGQRTLLDLLDSENEKFNAETAFIDAKYDHQIACYQLLASMGVLTESLGISLSELTSIAE